MDNQSLQICVIYHDDDVVQFKVILRFGEWSAVGFTYASPDFLTLNMQSVLDWSLNPSSPITIESGTETSGMVRLTFRTIDLARHTTCRIVLCTTRHIYPQECEPSRIEIEVPTALGQIEQFARECLQMSKDFGVIATLNAAHDRN